MVIEDLHNSYLISDWKNYMVMHYNGATYLPGSSPQGVFLRIFFFIVKYSSASLRPSIPRIQERSQPAVCKVKISKCRTVSCKQHVSAMHAVYINDLSELEKINQGSSSKTLPWAQTTCPPCELFTGSVTEDWWFLLSIIKWRLIEIILQIMIFNKIKKYDFSSWVFKMRLWYT